MTAKLVPEVADLLRRFSDLGLPPFHTLTPDEARDLRQQTAGLTTAARIEVGGTVDDGLIESAEGGIPVRFYTPGPEWPGTLVYLHGGGWVMGDLDTHDALCRGLTNASGLRVMAVQYRLAPEHPHPAALDDAWAATRWAAEREPGALAVGGDSAGGALTTGVVARARAQGLHIAGQLLIYPVTDLSSFETESYREFAEGHWLTTRAMEWFRRHYVPGGIDLGDPDLSPLHRTDLSGFPPAVIVTAECDVLRDEGAAYADRLRDAGIPVTYGCYDGVIHGFMAMPGALPQGALAIREAGTALRQIVSEASGVQ